MEYILPDYLRKGLDTVFVGTVAGEVSAHRQHYYAGYTNAFYSCLYESELVPEPVSYLDDWRLEQYGIGFTDLVKYRYTGDDSQLTHDELSTGLPAVLSKIGDYEPKIVCFTSKNAYNAVVGRGKHSYGLSERTIGQSRVFVVPSPSGRVDAGKLFDGKTRLEWFKELAALRNSLRLGIGVLI